MTTTNEWVFSCSGLSSGRLVKQINIPMHNGLADQAAIAFLYQVQDRWPHLCIYKLRTDDATGCSHSFPACVNTKIRTPLPWTMMVAVEGVLKRLLRQQNGAAGIGVVRTGTLVAATLRTIAISIDTSTLGCQNQVLCAWGKKFKGNFLWIVQLLKTQTIGAAAEVFVSNEVLAVDIATSAIHPYPCRRPA